MDKKNYDQQQPKEKPALSPEEERKRTMWRAMHGPNVPYPAVSEDQQK